MGCVCSSKFQRSKSSQKYIKDSRNPTCEKFKDLSINSKIQKQNKTNQKINESTNKNTSGENFRKSQKYEIETKDELVIKATKKKQIKNKEPRKNIGKNNLSNNEDKFTEDKSLNNEKTKLDDKDSSNICENFYKRRSGQEIIQQYRIRKYNRKGNKINLNIIISNRSDKSFFENNNHEKLPSIIKKRDFLNFINIAEDFYIITHVLNFNTNYTSLKIKIVQNYRSLMNSFRIKPIVIELAFENHPFLFTSQDNPFDIQLRSSSYLIGKENLINIALKHLPNDWKYVAWMEPEVIVKDMKWIEKAMTLLQKCTIIQLYSQANFLNSSHSVQFTQKSFIKTYLDSLLKNNGEETNKFIHEKGNPGLAWAANRKFFDEVNELFDQIISGSGEIFLAFALTNNLKEFPIVYNNSSFKESIKLNSSKINKHSENVGCLNSEIWVTYGQELQKIVGDFILLNNNYNPEVDIKKNQQGLIEFNDPFSKIAKEMKHFLTEK